MTGAGQVGTYAVVGKTIALHIVPYFGGPIIAENLLAPYSSEAIVLDPTRYYGDTIARRRVYIRQRGTEPDTITK